MKRNKVSIGTYLYWSKNLASMLYSKLLLLFGVRRSTLPIPEGMYCYTPDIEKNEARKDRTTYYIKPCKYYKTLGRRYNGCSYLGVITDDMTFDDQCKMCGENYGDDDEFGVYCKFTIKSDSITPNVFGYEPLRD